MDDFSIQIPGTIPARIGRPPLGVRAMSNAEKKTKYRRIKNANRLRHIAVLDMETDPFSDSNDKILPFCCELYSDQFGAIVIWDEDLNDFIDKVHAAILALPDSYTIYAHNGGKFDYMFLIHKIRGVVRFKGRAIMSCKIGAHELRDSLHILPEKQAAWKKEKFDYRKMRKENRNKYRDEILAYLHSDCVYLFDFIKRFSSEFGLKISIGQAAFTELKKHYKIPAIKQSMDAAIRPYFLGGRVECIAGAGIFESRRFPQPYRLYDVNSMYPDAMATHAHPVSGDYLWHRGDPNENTVFLDISCKSYGVFFRKDADGKTVSDEFEGRFKTTIWEFKMGLQLGLLENVRVHWCIDNHNRTNFSKFIVPMYSRREETKIIMKRLKDSGKEGCDEFEETKKENIFLKYLSNNSYGKAAQNPENYKEYCYTSHGERVTEPGWFDFMKGADADTVHKYSMPIERTDLFDVWARPAPGHRYNNVGMAASITGAARAKLLFAKANATDAIYCDTDSLICRDLRNVELSATKLGAWDIEETFDNVIIVGRKTYCCQIAGVADGHEKRLKVRSKGVDLRVRPDDPDQTDWTRENIKTWQRYVDMMDGKTIVARNSAPTFHKSGEQYFMTRRVKATAVRRAPLKGNSAWATQRS